MKVHFIHPIQRLFWGLKSFLIRMHSHMITCTLLSKALSARRLWEKTAPLGMPWEDWKLQFEKEKCIIFCESGKKTKIIWPEQNLSYFCWQCVFSISSYMNWSHIAAEKVGRYSGNGYVSKFPQFSYYKFILCDAGATIVRTALKNGGACATLESDWNCIRVIKETISF